MAKKISHALPRAIPETDWMLVNYGLKKMTMEGFFLENWLQSDYEFTTVESQAIDKIAALSKKEGDSWNDAELKFWAIDKVTEIADVSVPDKIKPFLERILSVNAGNFKINIKVDLMFAQPYGLNTPQKPYFFLQELKKGKKYADDPEGQMLAAMIAAQTLNPDKKTVLGAYVTGRNWYFATIQGQGYSLSDPIDSGNIAELKKIISMLRQVRDWAVNGMPEY